MTLLPIRSLILFVCLPLFLVAPHTVVADDAEQAKYWNNFRGPTLNGTSETAKPPVKWSATENVAWKTEIPGSGLASPIVWDDKVFVATAVNTVSAKPPRINRRAKKSLTVHQFIVMCLDRKTGEVIWKDVAAERKPLDGHHQDHGYASASPVTDGKHVYFSFGTYGIFSYDLDGNQVWKRTDLGEMQTRGSFGEGSSMALFEATLILPWDHEGPSKIEAIDANTGKTKWSVPRDEPSNWATPRIVMVNGRQQVLQAGENYSRGYDLETGKEIWRSSGLSSRPVSTPVVKGNLGYFASARLGAKLKAFYLDKEGDISDEPAWAIDEKTPDCPSLLLSEDNLYFVSGNDRILSCANADDGKLLFGPQRLPGIKRGIYSSPVAADGKVFVTGRQGNTVVIEDADEFKLIGTNDIGEPVDATLALVGNQIFIRGAKHLFCIEEK